MTTLVEYDRHDFLDSSALSEAYFSYRYGSVGDLYVRFHNNNVAGYSDVPVSVYDDLVSGVLSAGRHYAQEIKNKYHGVGGDVSFVARAVVEDEPESWEDAYPYDDGFVTAAREAGEVSQDDDTTSEDANEREPNFYVTVEVTGTVQVGVFDATDAIEAANAALENIHAVDGVVGRVVAVVPN